MIPGRAGEFFILAGLVTLVFQAWPGWKPGILMTFAAVALGGVVWLMESWLGQAGTGGSTGHLLTEVLLFFTKAGAFVFGSGLASFRSCTREWSSSLGA